MDRRVVEGVAGDHLGDIVLVTQSEAVARTATELVLMPGEGDVSDVGHTEVALGVESRFTTFGVVSRATHASEPIDDQRRLLSRAALSYRQRLGGEGGTSFVGGYYIEGVDVVVGHFYVKVSRPCFADLVEAQVFARALHDDIAIGHGGRLKFVGCRIPTQSVVVGFAPLYLEVAHRQGLDH